MKCLYLIRHAQSQGNVDPLIYSYKKDFEIDLTYKGQEQAQRLADEIPLTVLQDSTIFCSPYKRCVETMKIVTHGIKPNDIIIDYRIREQFFGKCENLNDIQENFKKSLKDPFYFKTNDGESVLNVFDRVHSFVDSLELYDNNNIIIFSHGITINVLRTILLGLHMEQYTTLSHPKNCELIKLTVR